MKKRNCCYAIVLLLIWGFGTYHTGTCQHLHSSYFYSRKESVGNENTYNEKRASKIGSKPPKCEHNCGACEPCIAIQVPTTAQFANYQTEAWKCYCQIK